MRRRRMNRPNRRTVSAFLVLLVMTAGICAYFERVLNEPPAARYPVTAPAQAWLQTAEPTTVGFFRANVTLPAPPTSAVLWVDGRDMYRVWVNGRLATTNRTPARKGALPTGDAVDVRSLLKSGDNIVAVQVSGLGEQTAALWARLKAETPRGSLDLGTDSGAWKATSNPALTGSRLGLTPEFINADFSTTGWQSPAALPALRAIQTDVPGNLMSAPALTTVSVRGFDATYTLNASLPNLVQDSWLQVAATGVLTVTVNGRFVTDEPAPGYQSPNSHRPATLYLIYLGRQLHSGNNELVFHVTGANSTAVALGGITTSSGSNWRPLVTSAEQWTVQAQGAPMASVPLSAESADAIWRNGFMATVSPVDAAASDWASIASAILPFWLVLLISLLIIAAVLPLPSGVVMGRIALCLGPGGAAIIAALAYGRWITVTPGFPYSDQVAAAVVVLLATPVLGMFAAGVLDRLVRRGIEFRRAVGESQKEGAARVEVERPGQDQISRQRTIVSRMKARFRALTVLPEAIIVLIATISGLAQGWRIGRQPLWQDEVTSIVVAQSIRQHGLPRLDSGLYYFKAELYHVLLAAVMSISDNPNVLRLVALWWFVVTVLAFGLILMPTLTARRSLQVIATAVFVVVPAEVAWAHDVRMYQQMQCFAVIFIALFIRALRSGRTLVIVGSAASLLAMYLSHEESFVILPALPVMGLVARRMVWARRKVFAVAFLPVGLVIAGQYAISHIHPPDFGDDLSNRPYVGWDPNQADFYYEKIFFSPIAQAGSMAVLSSLAVVAIVVGLRRRDVTSTLMAVALVGTVTAISLVLTAKVDRYSFVVIPVLVALAVSGGSFLVGQLSQWRARLVHPARRHTSTWLRGTVAATATIAVLATLATLVVSPRGFGLWAADVTNSPNPLTHPDYAPTVGYLRQHERPGDKVITLAPPVMAAEYLGRKPDGVIQTGRNKLLYLVLRNGEAVETILGVPVLLTGAQIRVFLEANPRVWLVSDAGSYIQGIPSDVRSEVSRDFPIVAQDATTTVSLWDAG